MQRLLWHVLIACILAPLALSLKFFMSSMARSTSLSTSAPTSTSTTKPENFDRPKNPLSDKIATQNFHHIEFYTGDVTSSCRYFMSSLGFDLVCRSDRASGNDAHISHMAQSGQLRFLFTAALNGMAPREGELEKERQKTEAIARGTTVSGSSSPTLAPPLPPPESNCLPGFSPEDASYFFGLHGMGVRTIAVSTPDVTASFRTMVANGGRPHLPPTIVIDKGGLGCAEFAEVELYGDVKLRLVNTDNFRGTFLPNFNDVASSSSGASSGASTSGGKKNRHSLCLPVMNKKNPTIVPNFGDWEIPTPDLRGRK
jgi:catechol 2,3-dioxygenase-like lactoylglutathione lyase family enzyme